MGLREPSKSFLRKHGREHLESKCTMYDYWFELTLRSTSEKYYKLHPEPPMNAAPLPAGSSDQ